MNQCEFCNEEALERDDIQNKSMLCEWHYALAKTLETNRDKYFSIRDRVKNTQRLAKMAHI